MSLDCWFKMILGINSMISVFDASVLLLICDHRYICIDIIELRGERLINKIIQCFDNPYMNTITHGYVIIRIVEYSSWIVLQYCTGASTLTEYFTEYSQFNMMLFYITVGRCDQFVRTIEYSSMIALCTDYYSTGIWLHVSLYPVNK